jgi:hypothetical protein
MKHYNVYFYDHVCEDTELTNGKNCCTKNWNKVSCKECLKHKPRSKNVTARSNKSRPRKAI